MALKLSRVRARDWPGRLRAGYEATLIEGGHGQSVVEGPKVEQDPGRYRDKLDDEPGQFEMVLVSVVSVLRRFRAGHTPYGPGPDADQEPPPWP